MAKNEYIGVNNVARKVTKPYIGVNNVARGVKNGYVGVDGIARQFYQSGVPISNYSVGNTVYLNENGVKQEYIVINIGSPSTVWYGSSSDGVWLIRKDIYENRQWNSDGAGNKYNTSSIHTYLNETFFGLFDVDIQQSINQIKIPYWKGTAGSDGVYYGENGLSTKVFLLSATETGLDGDEILYEGKNLSFFNSLSRRIAKFNGTASDWYLRTPNYSGYNGVNKIGANGMLTTSAYTNLFGIRPALVLSHTALV